VLAAFALGGAVSGCAADGTSNGDVTFKDQQVPFTFRHPADFTSEKVDAVNSRGEVVALRALDKVDVLAVRRVDAAGRVETRLRVLGKDVTSRVTPVGRGWGLECQYTDARRTTVLRACGRALRTLRFR
jgi:hypothetical protein